MSLTEVPLWAATNTLVKIGAGLLVGKSLAAPFGPVGPGLAANFHQLTTVLGMFAGVGIFNGVTEHVAQYHDNPRQLHRATGIPSAVVLGFSTLTVSVFMLVAAPTNQGLFGDTDYQELVRLVAPMQMGIVWGSLLPALMRGFRDVAGGALSLIVGSLIGVLAYCVSYRLGGYEGALLDLVLIPALAVIPAVIALIKHGATPLSYLKPSWDNGLAGQLSKFTSMVPITPVTSSITYIMIRKLLVVQYSRDGVRIWQGVSSIPDVYLQLTTASSSVYLLPTLSRLTEKRDITREVAKLPKFVLPAVVVASFIVRSLRDSAIWPLLLNKSTAMRSLSAWQLVDDALKVGACVLGYLVIAKASPRFYTLAEISQFVLLVVLANWLIPVHGVLGVVQVHMAAYIVYLSLYCGTPLPQRRWT